MYVFMDLHQRIASWPKRLFPRCLILDCSVLNPFSKCVFVLSRIFRQNQLPYLSKETLGCIHGCGLGKRKDAREVLSLCCHRGREHGLVNLLNRSVSLKICDLVSKTSILVKQALTQAQLLPVFLLSLHTVMPSLHCHVHRHHWDLSLDYQRLRLLQKKIAQLEPVITVSSSLCSLQE